MERLEGHLPDLVPAYGERGDRPPGADGPDERLATTQGTIAWWAGRGYGISPYTVAGEPEPARIRTPPVIIQPPAGGIWLSLARFSR